MPHIVIEYSDDLNVNLPDLCDAVFEAVVVDEEIHSPTSLKVRTTPCTAGRSGTEQQSFVHATLRLLPGRTDAAKTRLNTLILDELVRAFPDVANLSVEAVDLHAASYVKR